MAMNVSAECCAGIDVHQAQLRVCVRIPGAKGKRVEEFATFGTTTPDCAGSPIGSWSRVDPRGDEVDRLFWKPVYNLLEGHLELWWSTPSMSRTCRVERPM